MYAFLAAACALGCMATKELGTIEGHVTIGPLKPVERPGEIAKVPPEMYKKYKIVILDSKEKEIQRLSISDTGTFKALVQPGTYFVTYDGSSPMAMRNREEVKLGKGTKVKLSFRIDTGIR